MAYACHQLAAGLHCQVRQQLITFEPFSSRQAHFDQLMGGQGPIRFGNDGRGQAGITHQNDGLECVGEPFEVAALLF